MNNKNIIKKYLKEEFWEEALEKLEKNIPIQYIIGTVDFYGNEFNVNNSVLIPRFETETLVEKTINYINKQNLQEIKIADLGTGTGCIGITLEKELKASVKCFDISKDAIKVAELNKTNLNSNVEIIEFDIMNKIPGIYNVIVSNPPYIGRDEEVEDIVKNNEPNIALYADNEGLIFYEKILEYSKEVLEKEFLIAFEIGYLQGEKIKKIAEKHFYDAVIEIEKDLTGKDRFVFIKNKNE